MFKTIFASAVLGAISMMPAMAANCGQFVSGQFTLDQDLVCTGTGLIVVASNTTIDLAGHSITCIGAGYQGSCQPFSTSTANPVIGIYNSGFSNVSLKGPGKISGFGTGVFNNLGRGFQMTGVEVTGPAGNASTEFNARAAAGIFINSTKCVDGQQISTTISGNTINNQTLGIAISDSSCVNVLSNTVSNNNGNYNNAAHGIRVESSQRVVLLGNTVLHNGNSKAQDAGIMLIGNTNYYNYVISNKVDDNCGYGILASVGTHDTTFVNNEALTNPGPSFGLPNTACPITNTAFTDLAAQSTGASNQWNTNNRCRTQSGQIPAGVCNPNE